ncbi:MAG: site-specific integrase [Muribaculaceae bacterium]|nr:site-specific integrase [Muribaculaceae bacterium]
MVRTKFYLDTRKVIKGGQGFSLRLNITHNRKIASYPLGVNLTGEQWDDVKNEVVNHPNARALNLMLASKKASIDREILRLEEDGRVADMTATQIRDHVLLVVEPDKAKKEEKVEQPKKKVENTLKVFFEKFGATHSNKRTQELYACTWRRIAAHVPDEAETLTIEDIDLDWLHEFDLFMELTAPSANSRAIHMRNLRAVCNYAYNNRKTDWQPFRGYSIATEATRKRNFDVATLRRIFNHECAEEWQVKYRDFLRLTFMLVGINAADLCSLREVRGGRVEYIRAKTHKPYSIKVEAEARELLDRYAGGTMLLNYLDRYKNYRSFYMNMCNGLKEIRDQLGLEELTTYWMRHSWATIAYEIDIPVDTIAQALGHGCNRVTDIYIERDVRKVDDANRKVLDYVLHGIDYRVPVVKKRGRPRKEA